MSPMELIIDTQNAFFLSYASHKNAPAPMSPMEFIIRIVLSALVVVLGLAIGLQLRRLLVRRLQNTVLDNWLVQLLGIVVVLVPLLIAGASATTIATNGLDLLLSFLKQIQQISGIRSGDLGNFGKNLTWTLLLIVVAIGVARTLSKLTAQGFGEHRLDLNVRLLINRVFFIIVFLVAFFWGLAIWQINITLPVAVLGTLTVAITFSVQDILKDLVAGIYILLERPFLIGDQISAYSGGVHYVGKVVAIELRATRLRLVSGEDVTVPNSLVFGNVVVNDSRYPERRATITVTLPLEDFHREETPTRIIACLKEQEGVLAKPEPAITVNGISGEQIELAARFWITTGQLATVAEVVYALRTLLPSADLAVKEPADDM